MPDKSLQTRTMRKAVERVDIGVFGAPLRLVAWMRKKKGSWGGWAAMSLAQAAAGSVIAIIAGLALGVPVNAFSMVLLACFALGSAIGGPVSFTVWTAVLLPITGLLSGFIMGAWVASPSWWRILAEGWSRGEAVPGWFMIAVPAWLLFWVAASRGVSKVAEIMFEKFALRMGFKAASRFSGEDKRVYDEAFEQSDVSQAETATLLESSGDGTHSVITGEPSKMATATPNVVLEMGGDPDMSPVPLPRSADTLDYDSFLDTGNDDPDVMKAVGRKPTGLESLESDDTTPPETADAASPEQPAAVVIEMEPLNLPAVPRDTSPPLQRVEAPKIDPRQNRALVRRMSQLNLAFQTARREDRDAEFIEQHQDELAKISDEQRMILDSMGDTGPLVALIHSIQRRRTEDFLVGRAPSDLPEDTGSLDARPTEVDASDDDVPFDTMPAAPVMDTSVDAAMTTDAPEGQEDAPASHADTESVSGEAEMQQAPADRRRDIASMAASFSQLLTPRRPSDESGDEETVAVESPHEDSDQAENVVEQSDAGTDTVREDVQPVQQVETATDIAIADEAVIPTSDTQPVKVSLSEIASRVVGRSGSAPREDAIRQPAEESAPSSKYDFEFDLVPEKDPVDNATDVAPDTAEPEEEMSNRVFSRSMCREVKALVVGPDEPRIKADDVLDYEKRNSGVSVAEVLNSRSFDEHIGPQDAAAARHAWKDVKFILSQSSNERLVQDFERVNARGQAMVEEPHTLTHAAFQLLRTESLQLQRSASMSTDDETLKATADLIDRNMGIIDNLENVLKVRDEAADGMRPGSPSLMVRQKVRPGQDDAVASRGRRIVGAVLGTARTAGAGVMREVPATQAAHDAKPALDAGAAEADAIQVAPDTVPPVVDAVNTLRPGDEGFVSSHPVDSLDYQVEMDMHAAGVASRQRVETAARERAEQEERERVEALEAAEAAKRAEDDRAREEREAQAARERQEAEDEARRRREADEADAARRRQEAEEVARIEREAAEEDRRRKKAEADAAELALERERSATERSRQEDAVMKQFRDRQRDMDVPERFRTQDVMAHVLALSELKNVRMVFQRGGIGANIEGIPEYEVAMSNPSTRTLLQVEAETVRETTGVLLHIAALLDVQDPNDIEAIRGLLQEDEVRFFQRIVGQMQRGQAASNMLDRVAEAERVIRERAGKAEGVAQLESELSQTRSEMERVRAENEASAEALLAAERRAAAAERARVEAEQVLESTRREMAGIVDDDFQKAIEANGRRVDTGRIEGFFSFLSPDESSMVMVMTTPASAFPDGLVQLGQKAIPFADFLDRIVSKTKEVFTDNVAVVFTDPQIRAYASGAEGMTIKHIRRSVSELKETLNNYGISIPEQGDE